MRTNLQVRALGKIIELRNKSLIEIVEMCENENPICNVLFTSREALFAFFENYMLDVAPEFQNRATKQRNEFKSALASRMDIQSQSECRNWFIAFTRGFIWSYNVIGPLDSDDGPEFICQPKNGRFNNYPDTLEYNCHFQGTLPDEESSGIVFVSTIESEHLLEENIVTPVMWKNTQDVNDASFKANMYAQLLHGIDRNFGYKVSNNFTNVENFMAEIIIAEIPGQADLSVTTEVDPDNFIQEVAAILAEFDYDVTAQLQYPDGPDGDRTGINIVVYQSIDLARNRGKRVFSIYAALCPFRMD